MATIGKKGGTSIFAKRIKEGQPVVKKPRLTPKIKAELKKIIIEYHTKDCGE